VGIVVAAVPDFPDSPDPTELCPVALFSSQPDIQVNVCRLSGPAEYRVTRVKQRLQTVNVYWWATDNITITYLQGVRGTDATEGDPNLLKIRRALRSLRYEARRGVQTSSA
jgi:hypothetical protein